MFSRADILGTRPVASIEATKSIIPTGDAHQELVQRLSQIALGTSLQAEILSRLNDGSFTVRVADSTVRMNLPADAQVGKTVDLTLVAKQPNPVFVLASPKGDNTTTLSSAARLVDWILHTAKSEGAPTALIGKAPLVSSPNAAPEQIATALKNTLAYSGLFYESHVGQWANGERPLIALMYEPQAKNSNLQQVSTALRAAANTGNGLAPDAAKPSDVPAPPFELHATHLAQLVANLRDHPEATRSLMELLHAAAASMKQPAQPAGTTIETTMAEPDTPPAPAQGNPIAAPANTPLPANTSSMDTVLLTLSASLDAANNSSAINKQSITGTAVAPEALHSESVSLINLQLNTLEQQRVVWQGELWPGQPMEWEVSEDTPHGKSADEQERSWQSSIRFELPTLGKISASIRLGGERLQIQIRAASETTTSLLQEHGGALASALDAAGSTVEQLTVKRDESA